MRVDVELQARLREVRGADGTDEVGRYADEPRRADRQAIRLEQPRTLRDQTLAPWHRGAARWRVDAVAAGTQQRDDEREPGESDVQLVAGRRCLMEPLGPGDSDHRHHHVDEQRKPGEARDRGRAPRRSHRRTR